jgi:FkbM family methyltransferase
MPLLARILRTLSRRRVRGETRLRLLVVNRLGLLRYVPIQIADWPPVYMDLRDPNTRDWFENSPLARSDLEVDEQNVMGHVVKDHDVVFDVGANIGLHTALLSRLVGPKGLVVAFEPNPAILPALERTVGGIGNAVLLPLALSDRVGESSLYVAEHRSEVASLANWTNGDYGRVRHVTCRERRLDDLVAAGVIPRPDFMKCDVEGAELKVFQGAVNTLNHVEAPIVLFEANVHTARGFGHGIADAMGFLGSLGRARYAFYEVRAGGTLSREGPFNDVHANILALPHSRLARLSGLPPSVIGGAA